MKKKSVTFLMDQAEYDVMLAYCASEGASLSWLIRRAIKKLISPVEPEEVVPTITPSPATVIPTAHRRVPRAEGEGLDLGSIYNEVNSFKGREYLKEIGISIVDVVKARRNKDRGRPYDETMEKYFKWIAVE